MKKPREKEASTGEERKGRRKPREKKAKGEESKGRRKQREKKAKGEEATSTTKGSAAHQLASELCCVCGPKSEKKKAEA